MRTAAKLFTALFAVLALARQGPSEDSVYAPRAASANDGLSAGVKHSFVKRQFDYNRFKRNGHHMHCLMDSEEEVAESPSYLKTWTLNPNLEETEGWDVETDEHDTSTNSADNPYSLKEAFRALDITETGDVKLLVENWNHEDDGIFYSDINDDGTLGGMASTCDATGAKFEDSFVLDNGKGIVIAQDILSVAGALKEKYSLTVKEFEDGGGVVTRIRHWNDAVWMQWIKTCELNDGNPSKIDYIVQSSVQNPDSLKIIVQAVKDAYPQDKKIGKWGGRKTFTYDDNKQELFALLGSPNGAASARLLFSHKNDLGPKTIDRIDVFGDEPWNDLSDFDHGKIAAIMMLFHVSDPRPRTPEPDEDEDMEG